MYLGFKKEKYNTLQWCIVEEFLKNAFFLSENIFLCPHYFFKVLHFFITQIRVA